MSAQDFYNFLESQPSIDKESLKTYWKEWREQASAKKTSSKVLNVFTDGAVKDNKNSNKKSLPGGIGIYSEDYKYEVSECFSDATNNKAELKAILKALVLLEQEKEPKETIIWTDSIYSIKCCTLWHKSWEKNEWKTSKGSEVLNQDLIKDIISKLNSMKHVSLKYVKGHNGNEGNEMADKLATMALENNK